MMNQEITKRTTLTTLVAAYRQSEEEIRQGIALITSAENRLTEVFLARPYDFKLLCNHDRLDLRDADKVMAKLKKAAWRVLIERMAIRSCLSIAKANELDKQLETGDGLPDIEEKQILAMMEGTLSKVNQFIEEAVREVYDWLRPRHDRYKTNSQFKVGRKVVLSYCCEMGYGSSKFRVNYHRQKELTALDNVFHSLDGKGTIKTYSGPLSDAIAASPDGRGETDYFKFKCFKNHNLHLEFKRMDLVDQLNVIAGGGSLNRPSPQPKPDPEPEEKPIDPMLLAAAMGEI